MRDARATFAEVGLSAPAVERRVDPLVTTGAVRGFTAVVDPAALGWGTEAYVEVRCQGPVAPAELRRRLVDIPEVVEAVTVTGRADVLLRLLAQDVQHLERALARVRDELDVDATESVIVLSRLLDRAHPGRAGGEQTSGS